jgi:hypothetical protein
LFYLCTDCRRWIPFGRAGQHRKGAKHKGMAMYNAIGMSGRIGQ